jgi:UDP-N-acetylglucosamine diphosphorylase/glucosamine-1-phosphate N-acetyltransferase
LKAVILAAGRGERLWPLTEHGPKHLLPAGGQAILERTVSALSNAGVKDLILVVNYKAEMIRARFGEGGRFDCRIKYVPQKRIGGTADAVAAAQNDLTGEDHFLVIYGDDYYSTSAIERFVRVATRGETMIAAASVEDPSRFGTLEVKDGRVTDIKEKAPSKGPGLVNAGIYNLPANAISAVAKTKQSIRRELELTDSTRILIQRGEPIRIFRLEANEWAGVSYPWDLLEANRLALEADDPIREGTIEDNVRLAGRVIVSKGARVKSGSYLEGSVFLGEGAVVGPNAYLRSGTSLGKNVKVGAACEVKNSILMDEVKVPHLSYVGDSIIGHEASLGAGTITANLRFDEATVKSRVKGSTLSTGRKKLGAIIGDGVRTGINVSIYPGVKIGGGSWIGPGAVVREDVPSKARLPG